jgi:hypothetical protein
MKITSGGGGFFQTLKNTLARAVIIAVVLFGLLPKSDAALIAPGGGGTNSSPTYIPLNSWSFNDTNFWTSDDGCAPLSFTNLTSNYMGDGSDLVINNTNGPAWLQFAGLRNNLWVISA